MQGILRPIPTYQSHNLAGVRIDTNGRKFVVDEDAAKKFDVTPLYNAVDKSDFGDERKAMLRREIEGSVKAGFCDDPAGPLVLSDKAYAFVKELNGTAIMIEPLDGGAGLAVEQLAQKDEELAATRDALAQKDLEAAQLKARIEELEAASAVKAKK